MFSSSKITHKKQFIKTGLLLPKGGASIPECFRHFGHRIAKDVKALNDCLHFIYSNQEQAAIYEIVASLSCLAYELIQLEPLFDLRDSFLLTSYLIETQGTNAGTEKLFKMDAQIFEEIVNEHQVKRYLLVRFYLFDFSSYMITISTISGCVFTFTAQISLENFCRLKKPQWSNVSNNSTIPDA
jgi:hypothetical protein